MTDDDNKRRYLAAIADVWLRTPGETDEERHAEQLLRAAAMRLGYDEDDIVTWAQLGADPEKLPARTGVGGVRWQRGERMTMGEARALKVSDVVWYNYRKYPDFPNRINEATAIEKVDSDGVMTELGYDFTWTTDHEDADPAVQEERPGITTLYHAVKVES
jgi:hypothetical protein